MPRALKATKVAKPSKPSKSSFSSKPSKDKKMPLVRDLMKVSQHVQRKILSLQSSCTGLEELPNKVEELSAKVEEAEKERAKWMGKVEQEIQKHQLEQVQGVLADTNQIAVDKFELSSLRGLEKAKSDAVEKSKVEVKKEADEEVARRVRFAQVKFESEYAEKDACVRMFDVERATLKETIAGLRLEIEAQKELSSTVAVANKNHKINMARRKAMEEYQRKEDALRGIVSAPVAPVAVAPAPAPKPVEEEPATGGKRVCREDERKKSLITHTHRNPHTHRRSPRAALPRSRSSLE